MRIPSSVLFPVTLASLFFAAALPVQASDLKVIALQTKTFATVCTVTDNTVSDR